jgi:hypothetical protein
MLDYLTANIAFWMTLFGVQESLLEFRLGYLGRYRTIRNSQFAIRN